MATVTKGRQTQKSASAAYYTASTPVTYTDKSGSEQTAWTRIGTAWKLKDGDGFTVELAALPVNGRLVIKEFTPEED